jgi:hypothetical protein
METTGGAFYTIFLIPIPLNYLIMTAEVSSALVICPDFKWKTGLAAACGLATLMIGAIFRISE